MRNKLFEGMVQNKSCQSINSNLLMPIFSLPLYQLTN